MDSSSAQKLTYSREQLREIQKSTAVQSAEFVVPERCRAVAAAPAIGVAVVRHAKPVSASLAVLRQIFPDVEEDEIAPERRGAGGSGNAGVQQNESRQQTYVAPVVSQVERDTLAQIQKHFVQRMKSATTVAQQPNSSATGGGGGLTSLRSDKSATQAASLLTRLQSIQENENATPQQNDAADAAAAAVKTTSPLAKVPEQSAADAAPSSSSAPAVASKPAPVTSSAAPATATAAAPKSPVASSSPPSATTSMSAGGSTTPAASAATTVLSAAAKPHVPDFILRQLKAEPFVPKSATAGGGAALNAAAVMAPSASSTPFSFNQLYNQMEPMPSLRTRVPAPTIGERGRSGVVHYNPPMLTRDELCGEWEKWWNSCGWRFYAQFIPIPIPIAVDKLGNPLLLQPAASTGGAQRFGEGSGQDVRPTSRPLPVLLSGMGITVKIVPASSSGGSGAPPVIIPGAELKKTRRRTRGGKRRRGKRGGRGAAARAAARAAGLPMPPGDSDDSDDDDDDGLDDDGSGSDSGDDDQPEQQEQRPQMEEVAAPVFSTKVDEDEEEDTAAIVAAEYRELRFRTPDRNDEQQVESRLHILQQITDSPATIASSTDVALTADQVRSRRTRTLPAILDEEAAARRIWQRERQVALGTRTLGYKVWERMKATGMPIDVDCTAPRPTQPCSKRSWDGQMRRWRQQLHEFDRLATSVFTPEELVALPNSEPLEPIPDQLLEEDDGDALDDEDDFIIAHDAASIMQQVEMLQSPPQ